MRPSRVVFFTLLVVLAVSVVTAVSVGAPTNVITTVAGTGTAGPAGDGGSAASAQVNTPAGVTPMPDGGYLIADTLNNRVRRVSSTGQIATIAGTGTQGYSGDGGPATAAMLFQPTSARPTADGGVLIADNGNNRIRKVSASGVITTVAGNGTVGFSGDGGPATAAQLRSPRVAAPTADGGFLIADTTNNRIRKVSSSGVITTVAGNGTSSYSGDGGPATSAALKGPYDVLPLSDGSFLIADALNDRVRSVSSGGVISTIAGNGVGAYAGDGGAATAAELFQPAGLFVAPDGSLLIADQRNDRVRRVAPGGTIATLAGTGTNSYNGDGIVATTAQLNAPAGLGVTPDGSVLIADSKNHRIRSVDAGLVAPSSTGGTTPSPGTTTPGTGTTAPGTTTPGTGTTTPGTGGSTWNGGTPVSPGAATNADPSSDTPTDPSTGPGTDTASSAAPMSPALGVRFVAGEVSGDVRLRRPGDRRMHTVAGPVSIPPGSIVDATRGVASITTALPGGRRQSGSFWGGVFTLHQDRRTGVTDIFLRGGDPRICRRRRGAVSAAATRPRFTRRIWGRDHHGRFRTHGLNSVATVRGTEWLTEDRCDGTLTRVRSGAVDVRDLPRRVTVRVRAGGAYLARPRR